MNPPRLHLEAILETPLDWKFKIVPPQLYGLPLGEIGGAALRLLDEDFTLPAALVRDDILRHNSTWMRRFLALSGARIAPHGKTTMSPQLFQRQLDDGAWGLTAATPAHLRVYRRHGVPRILYANQLVGRADIRWVLDELARDPGFDFYCLIDSDAGLERLKAGLAARPAARPLQVLLEVGAAGGRTGVRSVEQGIALAERIAGAAPEIALRGIEAFEGIFAGRPAEQQQAAVEAMLEGVKALALACHRRDWFADGEILLSAGGSAFLDLVTASLAKGLPPRSRLVLRSGCYLTHDSLHYRHLADAMAARDPAVAALGEGLQPALEIVAQVQSCPEPGRVIVAFGKRDASYDIDLPLPRWWLRRGLHDKPQTLAGFRVGSLNDQHALLDGPEVHPLAVGDLLGFGISHPCTTFDKWPLLWLMDSDYRVSGALRTFF